MMQLCCLQVNKNREQGFAMRPIRGFNSDVSTRCLPGKRCGKSSFRARSLPIVEHCKQAETAGSTGVKPFAEL